MNKLQQTILSGKLRSNQCLIDSSLVEELGVNRATLRKAIKSPEIISYVTIHTNGWATVTDHNPKEIRDMY